MVNNSNKRRKRRYSCRRGRARARARALSLCRPAHCEFSILVAAAQGAPPENPKIVISCQARNKRKFVTTVTGLALFSTSRTCCEAAGLRFDAADWRFGARSPRPDIKHKDACKLFANKFSCGASLVKGKTDEIDIQGEVVEEVKTLVQETWNVRAAAVCSILVACGSWRKGMSLIFWCCSCQ